MPNPLEQAIAKGRGAVKGVEARLDGLTGVFAHLAEEHGQAAALLSRLKSSQEAEKREDLWNKIRTDLLAHERAEIQTIYPVLRQYPETQLIANEHDQQAGELEDAIDRLDDIDFTQDAWDTQLDVLISLVQRHVDEEEHEYFPEAQKVLGRDVAKGLEERFHQAKRACLASLE